MCYDARNKKYIVGFAMPDNVSAMVKMNDLSFADSAVEMFVTKLPLDHCNDMVYSPEDHKIYVVGGNWWVAVVDPDTLRVERKIPVDMVAWSLAMYPDGDFFVHDGERGERFTHDFGSSQTISVNDREIIIDDLQVPYRPERGDYAGVWQGAIVIDGMPYMIYNEFSLKTGEPISFVLFSCEMGKDRTIYRAETEHEIESADIVAGKMVLVYNETYRYGGANWEMSEISTKTITAKIEGIDIQAGKDTQIELAQFIPSGYQLVSANVNLLKPDGAIRTLPIVDNGGLCQLRVLKVVKNRIYLKSIGKSFIGCGLQIVGFCQKK